MKPQEVIKNNKLIAEFMGKVCNPLYYIPEMEELQRVPYSYECETVSHFRDNELKYHSSWDWLMPVVEKIEAFGHGVTIYRKGCQINDLFCTVREFNYNSKINETYKAVIEFIKWNNKVTD